jgi:AcrR family transcriptional regulator
MPATARAYRSRARPERTARTRGQILRAVRELLEEGAFHESTVEEVADRAGVARATLYQHFASRLDLVDAICETFAANPALGAIREAVGLPDLDTAVRETIAQSVRFWSSEDAVLRSIYGVVAIDPAARALVDRQRADRRSEMARLARRLRRPGLTERRALAALMVLTSYETFLELRAAGITRRDLPAVLEEMLVRQLP